MKSTLKAFTSVPGAISSRLAAAYGTGAACAVADGSFPIGDTIVVLSATGGTAWCACDLWQAKAQLHSELTAVLLQSILRLSGKLPDDRRNASSSRGILEKGIKNGGVNRNRPAGLCPAQSLTVTVRQPSISENCDWRSQRAKRRQTCRCEVSRPFRWSGLIDNTLRYRAIASHPGGQRHKNGCKTNFASRFFVCIVANLTNFGIKNGSSTVCDRNRQKNIKI